VKLVLDTNVVVSGLMTPAGLCSQIVDLVAAGRLQACVDARILAEYEAVLRRPELPLLPRQPDEFLDYIYSFGEPVTPNPLSVTLPHADDRPFLEVAHGAGAVLVTGNLRDLPKHARAGVTVLSPREFLDLLERSS
jgi:putative PIN family toxin of toxin-antitoxin system